MVNSTKAISKISDPKKIRAYYAIFLNSTATVAKSFGAKLVKNAGDAIIFYFPQTVNPSDRRAFRDVLECCCTMIASLDFVNIKLHSEGVEESINFRISADYGSLQVASSMSSRNEDLFGPTMNICAKINAMAEPNMMVVGGDLYRILKALSLHSEYRFKEIDSYSADNKHFYPVYTVSKYAPIRNDGIINLFHNLRPKPDSSSNSNVELEEKLYSNRFKKTRTIMLVDDEPDVLLVYKSFLSSEGYDVEVFTSPEEALAYFAKLDHRYYDLVIMDIRMPNINGFQLYQRLKAINRDVRVLFVSALEIPEELATLLPEIKNNDIVKKPVSKDNLLQIVRSKIESPIGIA
jgi:two-component system, OmpR family, response regulator ChvI